MPAGQNPLQLARPNPTLWGSALRRAWRRSRKPPPTWQWCERMQDVRTPPTPTERTNPIPPRPAIGESERVRGDERVAEDCFYSESAWEMDCHLVSPWALARFHTGNRANATLIVLAEKTGFNPNGSVSADPRRGFFQAVSRVHDLNKIVPRERNPPKPYSGTKSRWTRMESGLKNSGARPARRILKKR